MPELQDEDLRHLILGCLRVVPAMEQFPIHVREIKENYDAQGVVQSFSIITASGLKFTVRCDFEGQI